jgi:hypothetical protein
MSLEGWKSLFETSGVILLFLTFISGAGALYFSNRINAAQEEHLRQFSQDLRDKDVKIADALKATEDERMARTQLEEMVQPRDISSSEQKELRGVLHKFADRLVSVRSYALDTEGSRLATIILSVLQAAGVQTSDQRGNLFNLSAGWNVVEGLQIAGPHSQDDLINALLHSPLGSSQHLKMFRKEDPKILDTAPVEIMVGVKPIAVLPL